ncbi:SLC39A1 [Cordylochernes scorpioides]|uniref:SLC39A1 n=1 Tax=Cordylochernes scorpioides TaxID=51811 RepID=A0ABY6KUM5_9ARAC|nr:SLC39A1 [Cordylochernes scorpioides]
MELVPLKGLSLFLLFILTFFFCAFPLFLVKKFEAHLSANSKRIVDRVISFLNCFGGGVFLAACLLHLFPESVEEMEKVLSYNASANASDHHGHSHEDGEHKNFWPYLVMSLGFLLVLFVEQVTLSFKKDHDHDESRREMRSASVSVRAIATSISLSKEEAANLEISLEEKESNVGHSHLPQNGSVLGSIMLVLALSLHSIFEGMAIGFEESPGSVAHLLCAVLIHKCIIAFTLGLNLIQTSFRWTIVLLCNFIFSVMSPLGVAIAMVVTTVHDKEERYLVTPVLQALASGTFLYVTFFEILPHEINSNRDRILKQFFLNLGYAAMALLIYFFPA